MTLPEHTRRAERPAKSYSSARAFVLSGIVSAGLSFLTPHAALAGAEPVEQVAALLDYNWADLCTDMPVGALAFGEEVEGYPVISAAAARWLAEWDKTDFFDVAFTAVDGTPAPFTMPGDNDKGLVTVIVARPDHPAIGEERDGRVCVDEGEYVDFVPRSITPVMLDDDRPGRVMVLDYTARWSEPAVQRFQLGSERAVAVLLSFNPGKGWGNLEGEFTTGRGEPFPPDMFVGKGLSHIDLAAPHPHRIEIDGRGGPDQGHRLRYRFPEGLPDEVRRCATYDAPGIGACLKNVAEGGTILGRLSLCERDDVACMRDLLFAPPFRTVSDRCLADDRFEACAVATAALRLDEDAIVDRPYTFLRSRSAGGEIAVHLAGGATAYSAEGNEDGLMDRDETNRPWLSLACRNGVLAASLTWTGMPPQWKGRENVATSVRIPGKDTATYALRPDEDGRVLSVAAGDTQSFLRDVFAGRADNTTDVNGVEKPVTYYAFDLMAEDDIPLVGDFSFISRSASREGEAIPLWDGMDAACGLVLRAVMGD